MITINKCKENKDRLILTIGIQKWSINTSEARHLYKKLQTLLGEGSSISKNINLTTSTTIADGSQGMQRG